MYNTARVLAFQVALKLKKKKKKWFVLNFSTFHKTISIPVFDCIIYANASLCEPFSILGEK